MSTRLSRIALTIGLIVAALLIVLSFTVIGRVLLFGGRATLGGAHLIAGWPFMMGAGILPWLVLIGLVAAFAAAFSRPSQQPAPDSALEILRQRYARGEISKEQFDQMRRDLGA